MFASEYHFVTRWRFQGTPREVYTILDEPTDLVRWWPAVYLDVSVRETDAGKVYTLLTKGWLPYTLRWEFRRTEKVPHSRSALEARGDFVGRGVWTFAADGDMVDVVYDWRIQAEKPLLRYLSFVMKPIFAANHRWAMATGEESLRLELARRRATTEEERRAVPAPPGPTTSSSLPLLAGVLAVLGASAAVVWGMVRLLG